MNHQNFEHLLNQALGGRRSREKDEAAARDRQLQQQREDAARKERQRSQGDAWWADVLQSTETIKHRARQTASFLVANSVEPTYFASRSVSSFAQRLGLRPRTAGWVALKLSGEQDDNPPRPSGVNAVHYAEMCSSNPGKVPYAYPKMVLTTRGSLITLHEPGRMPEIHEATVRELLSPHVSRPTEAIPAWDERFYELVIGGEPASVDEGVWWKAVRGR